MAKVLSRNGNGSRPSQASKYDAHHSVLSRTYGALADLRRFVAENDQVNALKAFNLARQLITGIQTTRVAGGAI